MDRKVFGFLIVMGLAYLAYRAWANAQPATVSSTGTVSGGDGSAQGGVGGEQGQGGEQGGSYDPGASYGGGSYDNGQYGDSGASDMTGTSTDVQVMAQTIYGEARGESRDAQIAVAWVIKNRANDLVRYPTAAGSCAAICKQPYQFSCWNSGDPNLSVISNVASSNSVFQQCLEVAAGVIGGTIPDNTDGAELYHDTSIATPTSWGAVQETVQFGALIFYRYTGGWL